MNKFNIALGKLYTIFEDYKEIIAVYLYGSVARGDFSLRHSDLDLFIILNQKKSLKKSAEIISNIITNIGFQHGVRVQIEFQGLNVNDVDKSLLRKVMIEGRLIYSSGFVTFDKYKIGLKAFSIYKYFNPNKNQRARFSQILHGYKSFYYKTIDNIKSIKSMGNPKTQQKLKKERITKEYKGIIDNKDIIEIGKGAIMVSNEKEKYIKKLFDDFEIEYKFEKMIYSE
ncbi:nucleotidyltransferase domain-containing protein [Candidatus Woesearchaeota archaeon]|nr:nucleotidyltransferase domain-containing protein [Candidatus Woesearchaeota archaeon]